MPDTHITIPRARYEQLVQAESDLQKALKRLARYEKSLAPQPQLKCCSCGTRKNLRKDGWYGYRCNSDGCVPF